MELRRQNGFTRHMSLSQCVTKHVYHAKVVKLGTPTHLYMQILFYTNISSMKHTVNDMKVSQNIRRTINIALPSARHGNLGPTLLRHQIPRDVFQTTKNTVRFSSCDFHGPGRRVCMYRKLVMQTCMYRRHTHPRCHVEVYNSLHTFSKWISGRVTDFSSI